MEVERERAKQRMLAGKATDPVILGSQGGDTGKARDAVGAQLGVSGGTGSG